MSSEVLQNAAEKLRKWTSWARSSNEYLSVTVRDNYYSVDLGVFGEREMEVEVEDSEYEVDVENLLYNAPVSISEIDDIANELEAFEGDEEIATLDGVLTRMEEGEDENERMVARAVRAVVDVLRESIYKLAAVAMGPLPPFPLPWPGALRDDIDYTDPEFPLRYQPPPGWVWNRNGGSSSGNTLDYKTVQPVQADKIQRLQMVIDRFGRISWCERDGDDMSSGVRWMVWTGERDGIPEGNIDFGGESLPVPLDQDGLVIPEQKTEGTSRGLPLWNWKTESTRDVAVKRLRELRALAGGDKPLDYDPLTVELDQETRCRTPELRVGDLVNGYGRVLSVTRDGDRYRLEYKNSRREESLTEVREDYDWYMQPIATVNGIRREDRPTALSLSQGAPITETDYDPLTVPVKRVSYDRVPVDQLRLGDNITGSSFGRLTEIQEMDTDRVRLIMDRGGRRNTYDSLKDGSWDVEQIDVPNRDEIPTAFQLAGIKVPAPF